MPAKNPDPDWLYKTTSDPETLTPVQEKKRRIQPQSIQPSVTYIPQVNTVIQFSVGTTGVAGKTVIVTISDPNNTNSVFTATATCAGGETEAQVNGLISAAMIAAYESLLESSNFSAPSGAPSLMSLTYTPTWRTFAGGLPESPTVSITGTQTGVTAAVTTAGSQAAMVKTDSQPISKNTAWEVVTTTPILGAWMYDAIRLGVGIEVDPENNCLTVKKRRHNVPLNIVPRTIILTGAGVTASATAAGGICTGLTLGGAQTALYPEYVSLTFNSNGAPVQKLPSGYAYCSNTDGILNTIVLSDPGAGLFGVQQVTTGTVVAASGATSNGNLPVTVTGAGIAGSPVTVNVALTTALNTAALVAGAIRTALALNGAITALYTVGGTGANVALTAILGATNDATLNIAWTNVLGISALVTSAPTTAGVSPVPTVTVNPSATLEVIRKDIDVYTAIEACVLTTQSPFNSLANAIVSQHEVSFPFPARLDVQLTTSTQNSELGYIQPRSNRVAATIKTYWVVSDSEPTPPAYDVISPEPTITVSAGDPGSTAGIIAIATYRSVLIDANTQFYVGGNGIYIVKFNASTPSFSTYQGINYNLAYYSVTNGTTAVTGTNSHFLSDGFIVGQPFGNTTIQSINSDTSITLTAAFTEPTITNQPFWERLIVPGWINTVREPIAPDIQPTKNTKLWKIVRTFMIMQ